MQTPTVEALKSLAARAAWTFLQTFLALISFTGVLDADLSSLKSAAIAGVAAVLSVIKSFVGTQVGSPDTPTFK